MKVVIIGGSGLIGRKLGAILKSQGQDVVSVSPSTGVDSVSGAGISQALAGADVVVDVTNSPSFEDAAVLHFFRVSTGNLLKAAKEARVAHYIALSVVGSDRIHDSGYMRAKLAQEELIKAADVQFTILRATQFFEFLGAIAGGSVQGEAVHLPTSKFQPVAADDVASTLADLAASPPKNGVVELAGPDVSSLAEFVQRFLVAKGDARQVVADSSSTYFGAALDENGLAPTAKFITGNTRFADWVRAT